MIKKFKYETIALGAAIVIFLSGPSYVQATNSDSFEERAGGHLTSSQNKGKEKEREKEGDGQYPKPTNDCEIEKSVTYVPKIKENKFITQYINHARECTEHLNKLSNSKVLTETEIEEEEPDKKEPRHNIRSLVALAELLEDLTSVCVAIFYSNENHNEKLYISANKNLKSVRSRLEIVKEFLTSEDYDVFYKLRRSSAFKRYERDNRVNRRLERIFSDLPEKVRQAIRDNNIKYINSKYKFHAEMNLIQYLLDHNIELNGYLGISKLCCQSCTTGVYAIASTNSNLETVEAHGGGFPRVRLPDFIFKDVELLKHFLGTALYEDIVKYCESEQCDKEDFIKNIVCKANTTSNGKMFKKQGQMGCHSKISRKTRKSPTQGSSSRRRSKKVVRVKVALPPKRPLTSQNKSLRAVNTSSYQTSNKKKPNYRAKSPQTPNPNKQKKGRD